MRKYIFLIFLCACFNLKPIAQPISYFISAHLDTQTHIIKATEKITYINGYQHVLDTIYFHFWANAYADNTTFFAKQKIAMGDLDFQFATENEKGGYEKITTLENGKINSTIFPHDQKEIGFLVLKQPLQPNDTVEIGFDFELKMPLIFSRMGRYEKQYALTQWFPKTAVYENKKWITFPYADIGEFYSDFAHFNVDLTVPSDYLVAGTGDLLFENTTNEKGTKTYYFQAEKVHDFALFALNGYEVLTDTLQLPHKQVLIKSYFEKNQKYHQKSLSMLKNAVTFYNNNVGEYPWNTCQVVCGPLEAGGGMEYPTITIVSPLGSESALARVIAHEVGHNWFYGILATNERYYPWMDEGINSYYEQAFMAQYYPSSSLNPLTFEGDLFNLYTLQGTMVAGKDQPCSLAATDYTSENYGKSVYNKTAIVLKYLEQLLGKSIFDSCMHVYFKKFAFKHPKPEDFLNIFDSITQKPCSNFLATALTDSGLIQFKISKNKRKNLFNLQSNKAYPFLYNVILTNGDTLKQTHWNTSFAQINLPPNWKNITLNPGPILPENNYSNNSIWNKKITFPYSFKIGMSYKPTHKKHINIFPILAWNAANKTMLGLAFYNALPQPTKAQWQIAPLWDNNVKSIYGTAAWQYTFPRPIKAIQSLSLGLRAWRFEFLRSESWTSTFNKISPFATIHYNNNKMWSKAAHTSDIAMHFLQFKTTYLNLNKFISPVQFFLSFNHTVTVKKTVHPWEIQFKNWTNLNFIRSTAAATFNFRWANAKKLTTFRLFTGGIFGENRYGVNLLQWNGTNDFAYQHLWFNRVNPSSPFNQTLLEDGALRATLFRSANPIGANAKWVASLNFTSATPFPIPLKVYADIGTFAQAGNDLVYNQRFAWVAGITLPLIANSLIVQVPLLYSRVLGNEVRSTIINEERTSFKGFLKTITFVVNLNELSPLRGLRSIYQ